MPVQVEALFAPVIMEGNQEPMVELGPIIQAVLNHHPIIQAIYIYGLYGTEDERPDSDADIALLFSPSDSKIIRSPLASQLHLELEYLLNKNIDLINLRACPLASPEARGGP
ncbi:MAG TPA: hypothetical protein DDY22_14620 [Geobacter sp.]|nr:hypothetical protein [Geobacter sp.]